jgi:predicted  nucleic acid-binding Zn-ribbon protein
MLESDEYLRNLNLITKLYAEIENLKKQSIELRFDLNQEMVAYNNLSDDYQKLKHEFDALENFVKKVKVKLIK